MSSPVTDLPTGTITLLFTDIEGSTRLWETERDRMHKAVTQHDLLISDAVIRHNGFDLKKRGEGDSHFAVFANATDAANCALDIQHAISKSTELKIRIALHTGEAEARGGDYFGPTPNRCGRMRAAAYGGQTILSDATKRLIETTLPKGAVLKHLGVHRFKDLQEPERIYQLDSAEERTDFPELRSLSAAKHNLPIQLTSFVGREKQIESVHKLLKTNRLITLIGAGGSGKTRLSQQIAAELIDDYEDGVWFVPLVSLTDGKLIAQRIAASLPISLGGKEPMQAIVEEYKDAKALFIVDNCEHLTKPVASAVHQLLQQCANIHFLATSREPLTVKGEHVFLVPPLECDLHGKEPTADSVAKMEAAQLFRDRAASRLSGDEILTDKSAPAVAALCKKLDGIPLALEQAASNLSTLSPAQILERLERHFSMLPLEEEGIDARHRTIQATIDWSFGLLTEAERLLLERLSLFAGGWSLEAAEQICSGNGIPSKEILPLLDRLIKRSLVVAETADWGDRRYRMLEPIRQFAERKRSLKEEPRLHAGLLEWSFNVAREAHDSPRDRQQRKLDIVSAEFDNLRAALQWALVSGDRPIEALKICEWLFPFWLNRGHVREGISWIRKALELADKAPDELQAGSLNVLGVLQWQSDDLDCATQSLERSRQMWTQLGNRGKIAAATNNLAGIAFVRKDFAAAVTRYEQVAQTFREIHDLPHLANGLENLGVSHSKAGNLSQAFECLDEAVRIHRGLGHRAELAKALDSYIGIYDMQGRLLDAAGLMPEACDLALQSKDYFVMANILEICIRFFIALDDMIDAAQSYGAMALAIDRSERIVAPVQKDRHAEWAAELTAALGKENFRRAVREGRALGPETMIARLRDKLVNS